MSTKVVTAAQAERTARRTAETVERLSAEADTLEAAGAPEDVVAEGWGLTITRAQAVADLRERAERFAAAAARVRPGARVRAL